MNEKEREEDAIRLRLTLMRLALFLAFGGGWLGGVLVTSLGLPPMWLGPLLILAMAWIIAPRRKR